MPSNDAYQRLLAQGHELYPGIRIGRPGRSRMYWVTIGAMRALRLRWSVAVEGDENVAPGAAVLVGNHASAMDPVSAVMSHWWRVTAFTKVEVFERRGAVFFRLMGQIPLRRGDDAASTWALEMASSTLRDGNKVGLYPEGTRSPDPTVLHRLHPRILEPLVRANPGVPVHAIRTLYPSGGRRRRVSIALSPALDVHRPGMTGEEMAAVVRDALLALGGLTSTEDSAASAKRRRSKDLP